MRADIHVEIVDPTSNIGVVRNAAVTTARVAGKKYLLFRESDCEPIDAESTIDKYITQMTEYDLGVITYGFHKKNRVFDRANPMAIYHIYGDREEYFSRGVCKSFIVIDLEKLGELKFNEELKTADFELFLQEATEKRLIPINGFYFDIPKSWDEFKPITEKEKTPNEINERRSQEEADANWLKDHDKRIVFESNLDKLSSFLVDHWRNKCH